MCNASSYSPQCFYLLRARKTFLKLSFFVLSSKVLGNVVRDS